MTATHQQAVDHMMGMIKTAWDAVTGPLNGGEPYTIFWNGVEDEDKAPANVPHLRAAVRHSFAGRANLQGTTSVRRYTRHGMVSCDVMVPLSIGTVNPTGYALADPIHKAFEGASNSLGIWFRNVRTLEVGAFRPWFRFSVYADFQYDEVT